MPRQPQQTQVYVFSVIVRLKPLERSDYPDVRDYVRMMFKHIGMKDWLFQLEMGASGNWHCQGYCKIDDKMRPTALHKLFCEYRTEIKDADFLKNGKTAFGVKACSGLGKRALKRYCMKKDETYRSGPWGARKIYNGGDLQAMLANPYPFQTDVITMVRLEQPDDRKIIVYVNEGGCVGKSKLVKYLCWQGDAKSVPLGTATQIKTVVAEDAKDYKAYFIDLPRTTGKQEHMADLISAIEAIKNGMVVSAMYGRDTKKFMDPPHVIVMTNHMPPLKMLSADRWDIYRLNSDDPRSEPEYVDRFMLSQSESQESQE